MPYREQPLEVTLSQKSYPGHDYTGTGTIVAVRAGTQIVGYLTRKGDAVGWVTTVDESDESDAVRIMVWEILNANATAKNPLIDAWVEVLDNTQHDAATTGDLAKIAKLGR